MSDIKSGSVVKFAVVGLILVLVSTGAAYLLLPKLIFRWLGGDDFRQLASKQLSTVLKTEGELEPLAWSSFTVQSGGFTSRPDAPGPWLWKIQNVKTSISVRLLLDRVLRFPEITIDSVAISQGLKPNLLPVAAAPAEGRVDKKSSSELLKDVQIGRILIQSFGLKPSSATSGWGVQGVQVELKPAPQQTEFELHKGKILTPFSWVGVVDLDRVRGYYADPKIVLQEFGILEKSGGSITASGEFISGQIPQASGQSSCRNWSLPGNVIGLGMFEIPAKLSGNFRLIEWRSGGPVGDGQVNLESARLEPGKGSESILAILALLTGEPRLNGCPLTTARATWSLQPGRYEIREIVAEAPGLLRSKGQVQIVGNAVKGQLQLGLAKNLGSKLAALTGGELFSREEAGYLYEPVNLSGTMERPQNDLEPKLKQALTRTAVRTTVDIIQKATGNTDPNTPAGATGQILKSLFGPAPK